jgi:hypothetical protein
MNKFGNALFAPVGGTAVTPPTFTRAGAAWDSAVSWAPTNLEVWSEDLSQSVYTKNRVTVTTNAVTAPDGALTADKLVEDATATSTHYLSRSTAFISGLDASISFYAKAGERSWIVASFNIGAGAETVYFNVGNGTVGTKGGNITIATIAPVGGGWYRCSLSKAANALATLLVIGLASGDGGVTYSGDGASGAYVWGIQLEQTLVPSTYIPTTSAAVGLPRFDGPDYEPTVNLALYSQDFTNTNWTKDPSCVVSLEGTAPDGSSLWSKLTASAAGNGVYQRPAMTASTPQTLSVYVMAGTCTVLRLVAQDGAGPIANKLYDLTTGVITDNGSTMACSTAIESLGNGVYRCSLIFTPTATNNASRLVAIRPHTTGTLFAWGAQAELKDHATPYVGATLGTPRARGILAVEPTRNDFTYSQQFDNAAWTKTGSSIVPNATTAPDGTLTAAKFVESAANQQHLVGQSSLGTGFTVPYTVSIYAKAGERTQLWMNPASSQAAYFNLDTGLVSGATGTNSAFGMTPVGNGWYRCWAVIFAGNAANASNFWIGNNSANSYAGDGTSGIYIWGAQFERIQGPSPYLATTTTALNRAGADFKNGVVVEEGTTNLVQYSDASNAYWSKTQASVPGNVIVAPDGTLTGCKLTSDTTATARHSVSRASVFTSGQAATVSFYAKPAGWNYAWVEMNDGTSFNYIFFDLVNGTVSKAGGTTQSGTITPVGGGWFRCSMTQATPANTATSVNIGASNALTINVTGDGTSGIYLWGIQAEQKAYPTSLVPTSGANGVRVAETINVPVSGVMKPDQGTIVVRAYVDPFVAANNTTRNLFRVKSTIDSGAVFVDHSNGNFRASSSNASGSANTAQWTNTPSQGWHYFGMIWSAANLKLWADGSNVATTPNPVVPATLTDLGVGYHQDFTNRHFGSAIAYVVVYDRVLSDTEMAAATVGNLPGGYKVLVDGRNGVLKAVGGVVNLAYDDQLFGSINRAPYTI